MEQQFVWSNIAPGTTFVHPTAANIARQFYERQDDTIIVMHKAYGRRLEIWHTGGSSPDDEYMVACANMDDPSQDIMYTQTSLLECLAHLHAISQLCLYNQAPARDQLIDEYTSGIDWCGTVPEDFKDGPSDGQTHPHL